MSNAICVFGDSIMKGVVYDKSRSKYIYSDNSFVKKFIAKTGLPVDNYAKFGCTLIKGQKIIEKYLSELSQYKFIALEFGGNDCDYLWPAISEDPCKEHQPNTPLKNFEAIYAQIIDKLVEKRHRPVLFSLPPLEPYRYFSWISNGLNRDNILKWLGDIEFIYRWQEKYNNVVEKLAMAKQIPLIDIRSAFLKVKNYETLLCEDGIHPNEAGHSLILDTILNLVPDNRNQAFTD